MLDNYSLSVKSIRCLEVQRNVRSNRHRRNPNHRNAGARAAAFRPGVDRESLFGLRHRSHNSSSHRALMFPAFRILAYFSSLGGRLSNAPKLVIALLMLLLV